MICSIHCDQCQLTVFVKRPSSKRSKVTVIMSMPWVTHPPSGYALYLSLTPPIQISRKVLGAACHCDWLCLNTAGLDQRSVSVVTHSGPCVCLCMCLWSLLRLVVLIYTSLTPQPLSIQKTMQTQILVHHLLPVCAWMRVCLCVCVCARVCVCFRVSECESKRRGLSNKRQKGICFPFHCQENGKSGV